MFKKIPNYIKYICSSVFFLWVFIGLFRVAFYFLFADVSNATIAEVQKAFFLGLRFDIKLAVITLFPLALFVLIVNYRFFKHNIYRKIGVIYTVIAYLVLALFFIFDFGYYDYLSIRLDASSLRFLSNLGISTQVLLESYPVFKGLLALLVLIFIVFKFSKKYYANFKTQHTSLKKKWKAVYFIVTFLLLSFGIYNSLTHYPLRWSEAFFSKNNAVNQFALNPVLYFFDSFAYRSEGVDIEEFKKYYPVIANHLKLPKDTVNFERKVVFDSTFTKKPNVVIVMLESLGVKPMSYYGNPIQTTPVMDSLLQQSINFSNFYVHKSGTAASVFASVTGLPDIEDIKTASRNPMIQDQRIIFDQFDGYEKLYFLGGSANWANIRGVFQSNIKGLKIYEEGSYETEKRADVWGMDDYELFKEADKILAEIHQQNKPFIAYIQTASNHIPFTVPDQKESYKPLTEDDISNDLLEKSGFKSIAQLNALRYLDFNVGKFLERAKRSGYYDNTVFAFFGDHNTAMKKTTLFTKEYDLNIQLQHVPLFIHAPKFVTPKINTKNGKLIDLFPTLASVVKLNHTNYTLGNNLLDNSYTNTSSFVYLQYKGEPTVGILQDSLYYFKTNTTGTNGLYDLKEKDMNDLKDKLPLKTKRMDSLLKAFYHSTKYLYFNNKKLAE